MGNDSYLEIFKAEEHNLKIDYLKIPKNRLVVFSGVSGSGKSSLAFDTLFAEGQRRYIESLSSYARQFLGQLEKPKYEKIKGLSPTISIEQKKASSNPRSTVGTVTEIYDYLRVLYARVGVQRCYKCGRPVLKQNAEQIVDEITKKFDEQKIIILAPVVKLRKGTHKSVFEEAQKNGFVRLRVNKKIYYIDEVPELDKNKKHTVEIVVDRIKVKEDKKSRIFDSVELALKFGNGKLVVLDEKEEEHFYSEHNFCDYCGISYPELSPQLFSFNSPIGMCKRCNGLGKSLSVDETKLIDQEKSITEGAIKLFKSGIDNGWTAEILKAVADKYGFSLNTPWKNLTRRQQEIILYGTEEPLKITWGNEDGTFSFNVRFEGIVNTIARRFKETKSDAMLEFYQTFFKDSYCPECGGTRLRKEARSVYAFGKPITEIINMQVKDVYDFFESVKLSETEEIIAKGLLREIKNRLKFLVNVGLSYLTLNRNSETLSGGEAQRIRLASQLGNELSGVMYVLDEPSIGLHQRDNRKLLDTLLSLRDLGNTVLVVEHDRDTIESADFVVDFGPYAGKRGGKVVYAGDVSGLKKCKKSLTGQYLTGKKAIKVPEKRRKPDGFITIVKAEQNNLKGIDVSIPLGVFTVITGVSGAGKSSLLNEIVWPALSNRINKSRLREGKYREIKGYEKIDRVINIDQNPIGRTPRSNPATYTKVFDKIREVFSKTKISRMYGYAPGRFSFNVKGGRCEHCKGDGQIKIEMHFLPDVYIKCPQCKGKRFNEQTLKVLYKEKNIADVLEMTVDEAYTFFENHRGIKRILKTLKDVGLGYIELGQPSPTLSGGEAQRIKLSRELARGGDKKTLYILDEPTTGLHFDDINKLLKVLNKLVDRGNTVLMIEHNMDVIKSADYIIDLGPEGGDEGGFIVFEGTPEEIVECEKSYTGKFLKEFLK